MIPIWADGHYNVDTNDTGHKNRTGIKMKNRIAVKLWLFIFFILNTIAVEAATVRVNPTKIRLIIPPGESRSGLIEVDNPSDEALVIKAYLQDWLYTSAQDGTKDFFPAASTPTSCAKWISLSFSDFVIPAFSKQNINYTVKVPKDAEGGHYAVLFFESLLGQPELKETPQLGVLIRVGALFYIEPQGTVTRSAEINNLSLKKTSDKGLEITLDFKNSGNADIISKSTFHIIDSQGMVAARGDFNDVYTFPVNSSKLTAYWKEIIPKGKYSLVITLDMGKVLEEAKLGSGPVITKESEIEIGNEGEPVKVGILK